MHQWYFSKYHNIYPSFLMTVSTDTSSLYLGWVSMFVSSGVKKKYWYSRLVWAKSRIISTDLFLFIISIKTSNSSSIRNGGLISSQSAKINDTVEKLFSPPDKVFMSRCLISRPPSGLTKMLRVGSGLASFSVGFGLWSNRSNPLKF